MNNQYVHLFFVLSLRDSTRSISPDLGHPPYTFCVGSNQIAIEKLKKKNENCI